MVEGVMFRPRYGALPTEQPNPRSRRLDSLAPVEIVSLMNREDRGGAVAAGRGGRGGAGGAGGGPAAFHPAPVPRTGHQGRRPRFRLSLARRRRGSSRSGETGRRTAGQGRGCRRGDRGEGGPAVREGGARS